MSSSSANSIRLEALLCTGERQAWIVNPKQTIGDIKNTIWASWPSSWSEPRPDSARHLRLLHLGRFWDNDSAELSTHKLPLGRTTIVHMLVRPALPPSEEDADANGSKLSQSRAGLWAKLSGRPTSTGSSVAADVTTTTTDPNMSTVATALAEPAPAASSEASPASPSMSDATETASDGTARATSATLPGAASAAVKEEVSPPGPQARRRAGDDDGTVSGGCCAGCVIC